MNADVQKTNRKAELLALKKEELLRAIVDNVGKRGSGGQDLQNVVSVAMTYVSPSATAGAGIARASPSSPASIATSRAAGPRGDRPWNWGGRSACMWCLPSGPAGTGSR